MTVRETPGFAKNDALDRNGYRLRKFAKQPVAFSPPYRAELHPIGGGHHKWMETGDPPVHRDRTGAVLGSLG